METVITVWITLQNWHLNKVRILRMLYL